MLYSNPAISVIVCTYNRVEYISLCIDSLLSQTFKDYEIVVIDNNSSDGTLELIKNNYHGKIKIINESNQGLSFARNCGLKNASGDIVAYIDDDAIADKDWLAAIYDTFTNYPEAACVGGRIFVKWIVEKPEWWIPELDEIFNNQDYGKDTRYLNYPQFPFGTNISFKKNVILEFGGFNTNLGRIGNKSSSGEEQYLCFQLYQDKHKLVYNPKIFVHHLAYQSRLTKESLLVRYSESGASHAYLFYLLGKKHLLKEIYLMLPHLLVHSLLIIIASNHKRIRRKLMIAQKISFLKSSLSLAFKQSVHVEQGMVP